MIKLEKIVEYIYGADSYESCYYDRQTAELIYFSDYYKGEKDEENAELIENSRDRFVLLPSSYEIKKYRIMVKFIEQFSDGKLSGDLYDSIRGKGAYRRFKNTVHYYGIEKMWYQFEENAYKEIAIKWCKDNGIEFEE